MRITQRTVALGLLFLLSIGALLITLTYVVQGQFDQSIVTAGTFLAISSLLFAYWRGWEYARHVVVISVTLITAIFLPLFYGTQLLSFSVLVPPVLALVLVGPDWVIGSALVVVAGMLIQSGGTGAYTDPFTLIVTVIIVGGMVLSRMITDTALRAVKANEDQAKQALARSEIQTQELAQKAGELTEQNEQQRRLLDLVATLETPVVALAEGVILAPVVGHLDSRRADDLTRRVLHDVSTLRARQVIIDIAGVPTVDTQVAQALLRTAQAIRLLGCQVTITGISASVATTMTQLGINMAAVQTARTPQEALEQSLLSATHKPALITNGKH